MSSDVPLQPGLASFKSLLPSWPVEKSTEYLVSLLRRRQIRGSKSCALATAWLLRKVISSTKASDPGQLLSRARDVGFKLIDAAPRELAVGNIVRRVLGAIREEDDNRTAETPASNELGIIRSPQDELHARLSSQSVALARDEAESRAALVTSQGGGAERRPPLTSMFSILSHPTMRVPGSASPMNSGASTPATLGPPSTADFRTEVLEAITEIIDELDQADEQVAGYALEHVLPQETILVYSSSSTVQRFLLKAASRRKFTVVHAEGYPNAHRECHAMVTGNKGIGEVEELDIESFQKPLISSGITVILVPDSAIFSLMSRVNKVVLSAHGVFSDGSILATAGSQTLVHAAKFHRVPVLVLAATYKLSPLYPFNPFEYTEYEDVAKVVPAQDRELSLGLQRVHNPLNDFIEAGAIDLFVTNLGGCATGYLYRVVRDQYRDEDLTLTEHPHN